MRNSLLWKLTLAFILVAITTAALVAIFIRITSVDRLNRLILDQQRSSLQTALSEYYSTSGSWKDISNQWQHLRTQSFPILPQNNNPHIPNVRDRRRLFGLVDTNGKVLISIDPHYPNGSTVPPDILNTGTPVIVNNTQVGSILTANLDPGFNPEENLFLQRTNEALIFAVIGAVVISLLIGILLARTLIRPLRALTDAAQNIAQGQLEQQVNVKATDELGQLAAAFNRMSQEVTRVNQLRRQMTADIAHDLRTPLTVIAGYVESMRDGVLQPTPARLSIIYTEIERLQNLVGDLKMLSQVDSGELPLHPLPVAPEKLLEIAAAPFQHRAEQQQIQLEVKSGEKLPLVRVDEARMMQVFGNLLSNAMRYTPKGGCIELSGKLDKNHVALIVRDNGEGISEEELPYIFDRFHRADKSRHADAGETGLGLAIVKALVEAHGGSVAAESKPDQGTSIIIYLPISQEHPKG